MRKNDGCKLPDKALEEIRIRAVEQVQAGHSREAVIAAPALARPRIYEWLARFREGGFEALAWLYRTVSMKKPLQRKFEFVLGTREVVRSLMRSRFCARLSEVSVGRLHRKLGLSPERLLARAYERDPQLVERWMKRGYPKIRALAKWLGAQIFFAEEASVRSDHHRGRAWAPLGKTPPLDTTGARVTLNMLSAISPRGELRFMLSERRLTTTLFIEFLKRLLHNQCAPFFLIVNGHPVHRSGAVRRFVVSTQGRLRLFQLPPYVPDLNLDEQDWNHLKTRKGRQARRPRHRVVQAPHPRIPARFAENPRPGRSPLPAPRSALRRSLT